MVRRLALAGEMSLRHYLANDLVRAVVEIGENSRRDADILSQGKVLVWLVAPGGSMQRDRAIGRPDVAAAALAGSGLGGDRR